MILASSIGAIAHPFFIAFAWLIERFYALIPNYAVAIAMLTIVVMVVVFPITRRATRSMMKMQLLAPELKKIQTRYKAQPGMSVPERQESRQRLNEEMMALYRENNVSPTGGCLPMLLQLPMFWILYGTIKGLIHTETFKTAADALAYCHHTISAKVCAQPLYISHSSQLYKSIIAAGGKLNSFGVNLADSVRTSGLSWGTKAPLIVLILVAIALQYIQIKQVSGRNKAAAAANPQMQQMQRVMPIIFAVIYIAIPAGVNVYFIISSLFRISQQEFMYRRDPHIRASMAALSAREDPACVQTDAGGVGRAPQALSRPSAPPTPALSGPVAGNGDGAQPPSPQTTTKSGNGAAERRPIPQGGRGPGGSPGSASRSRAKRRRHPR